MQAWIEWIFYMYQFELNLSIFLLQVLLIFLGNTVTIKIWFYTVFIYVYFHVRIMLHYLGISLLHEDGFNKVKNSYIKSAYYSICDDYSVNADKTWLNRDWYYMNHYGNNGDGEKTTKRSTAGSLTWWIINQSKVSARKDIWKKRLLRA